MVIVGSSLFEVFEVISVDDDNNSNIVFRLITSIISVRGDPYFNNDILQAPVKNPIPCNATIFPSVTHEPLTSISIFPVIASILPEVPDHVNKNKDEESAMVNISPFNDPLTSEHRWCQSSTTQRLIVIPIVPPTIPAEISSFNDFSVSQHILIESLSHTNLNDTDDHSFNPVTVIAPIPLAAPDPASKKKTSDCHQPLSFNEPIDMIPDLNRIVDIPNDDQHRMISTHVVAVPPHAIQFIIYTFDLPPNVNAVFIATVELPIGTKTTRTTTIVSNANATMPHHVIAAVHIPVVDDAPYPTIHHHVIIAVPASNTAIRKNQDSNRIVSTMCGEPSLPMIHTNGEYLRNDQCC